MMPLTGMIQIMSAEYESPPLQTTTQAELESLLNLHFMSENYIFSVTIGLTNLVDHINMLTRKYQPHLQDEQHTMIHLRIPVLSSQ